jgi:uncharacterized phage protein (TIGR02218 family)
MLSITFDGEGRGKATFSPRSSSSARVGKRRMSCRLCPHVLYGPYCRVNDAAYRVEGTLSSVDGRSLVSSVFSGYSDDYFNGGKIQIGYAKRAIIDHASDTITVDRVISAAASGSSFAAYPGCDKAPTTCHNKYKNKANYGGLEFLPTSNVFGVNINDLTRTKERSFPSDNPHGGIGATY